jgi:hypothetical protein
MPFDIASWKALFISEWQMIAGAPFDFAAAVIVGWAVGWLIIRAWYRQQISSSGSHVRNLEAQVSLAEASRDIERRQKEGLRAVILEMRPGAPITAMEVSHGDSEVKQIVSELAAGKKIETRLNPAQPRTQYVLVKPDALKDPREIKQIAVLVYTTDTGLSKVEQVLPDRVISSATPMALDPFFTSNRDT